MTDTLTPDETLSEVVGGEGHGLLTLPSGTSIPYRSHPLADLFPMIEGAEFKALVEDVRERGVQRPIVLLDGMVLDGRNRYLAAREAEVGYPVVDFTGSDPLRYVISENMRRRHLTDAQRAMVAARLAKLPPHRPSTADLRTSMSAAEAARELSVSPRTVEAAKAVVRDGSPELVAAVDAGAVSVTAAAEVAKLPEERQAEIVAEGPKAVQAAAKASRAKPDARIEPTEKRPPNGLSGLSRDGLEDEVIGLREENADLRTKLETANDENGTLKTMIAELSQSDSGKVISNLQRQLQATKLKRDDAMIATKREEFKRKQAEKRADAAEARMKELEQTPIDMGVQ